MKKAILLAVVAVAVTSASCRKERTCTCEWTSTNVSTVSGNSTTTTSTGKETYKLDAIKKRDAIVWAECTDHTDKSTSTNTFGGITVTSENTTENTCTLD